MKFVYKTMNKHHYRNIKMHDLTTEINSSSSIQHRERKIVKRQESMSAMLTE